MSFRIRVSHFVAVPTGLFALALCAFAQTYTLSPADAGGQTSIAVTITTDGTFSPNPVITFDPNVITTTGTKRVSNTQLTTVFKLKNYASGTVVVSVDGKAAGQLFDTDIQCLESLSPTDCALRLEIDVTGVNGSSSQTNTSTTPNFLFKLDYQWAKNKDSTLQAETLGKTMPKNPGAASAADRLATHLLFKTGYTQVNAATKLQSTQTGSSTNSTGSTPGSSTSSTAPACTGTSSSGSSSAGSTTPATCTAATPQQAFVADLGGTLGWTIGQDGKNTFAEIGFGGRAAFQDLVPTNQVVNSGGVNYVQLTSLNPHNVSGLYEAVGRFRIAALGHDSQASKSSGNAYGNASDFLVFEAGYQNNSGMTQLASDPSVKTRNRFVGRFYMYPELPGTSHTKILIGMEYSGGISGGPGTVQIFFGPNLNIPKLLSSLSGNKSSN